MKMITKTDKKIIKNYIEKFNILIKNTIYEFENKLDYIEFIKNIDYYNNKYKNNVEQFFIDNKINKEDFFYSIERYKYIPMLKKILNNVDKILLSTINLYFSYEDIVKEYNDETINNHILSMHTIYDIRFYLFNNDLNANMLNLDNQNKLAKNYILFDFSMNKPKCLKDLL